MIDLGAGLVLPAAADVLTFDTREEWEQGRLARLGGSDIGKLLGVAPLHYGGEWAVWAARTVGQAPPSAATRKLYRSGHREEARILEDYRADRGGRIIGPVERTIVAGPHPVVGHSPDAFEERHGEWGLVELKTDTTRFRWGRDGTVIERWSDEAREVVREDHAAQCYWGLAATGLPWARLIVRRSLRDTRAFLLKADPELQARLVDLAAEWWERHIAGGERPSLTGQAACHDALARLWGAPPKDKVRDATEEERELARRRAALKAEAERIAAELSTVEAQLKASVGEHYAVEWGEGSQRSRITYYPTQGRAGFDLERFEFDHPELHAKYRRPGRPGRDLRVRLKE